MKTSIFNVRSNTKLLFSAHKNDHIPFLDGLRAIAILWVILFHCIHFFAHFNLDVFLEIRSFTELRWMRWGFHGVDIFFVISGFIISYLLMNEWKERGRISIKDFYYRRALRLLPAYYLTMLIVSFILSKNLPNIWANILYVNNLLPIKEQFMPWAWSLAIEEQFYIIFPLLLAPLLKQNKGSALTWLLAVILLAFAIRFWVVEWYDVQFPPPHNKLDEAIYYRFFDLTYDKLWTRFGQLLLGVIAAYIVLFTSFTSWLSAHKNLRNSGLLAAIILMAPAIFAYEPISQDMSLFAHIYRYMFLTAYPYLFAIGVTYIIVLCTALEGHKSFIRSFLSAKCFFPVAQLSYSAYLIHPIVILFFYKLFYNPESDVTVLTAIVAIILILLLTFICSIMMYLLVERPIMNSRRRFQH